MNINQRVIHDHGQNGFFAFAKVYVTVYWTPTQRWCVRVGEVEKRGRVNFFYTNAEYGDTYRSVILRATGRKRLWGR